MYVASFDGSARVVVTSKNSTADTTMQLEAAMSHVMARIRCAVAVVRPPVDTFARLVASSLLGFTVGVGVWDISKTLTGTIVQPLAVVAFTALVVFLWFRLACWVLEPLIGSLFTATGGGWVVPIVRAGDQVVQATITSPADTVKLWVVVRSNGVIEGFSGPIVVADDAVLVLPTKTLFPAP